MGFTELLGLAELAALTLIAGLLYQLLKESRLLRRRMESGREKKEGQTINVNLASVPIHDGKSQPASPPAKEPEPKEESEPEEPKPPPPTPQPVRSLGSVSITPSGAIALKCPKCGAENSSYRTECFTCGATLR